MRFINLLIILLIPFLSYSQDTKPDYSSAQLDSIIVGTKKVDIPTHFNSNGNNEVLDIDVTNLVNRIKATLPTTDTRDSISFVNDSLKIEVWDKANNTLITTYYIDNVINKNEVVTTLSNTLPTGHIIGTYTNESNTVTDINESVIGVVNNADGSATITKEDGTTITTTPIPKKCDGTTFASNEKTYPVQNLPRQSGYAVTKQDGVDCLGNNDEFYNASLKNYYANAAFGNYAIGEFSRVLNGLSNVTNGGADIIGSSSGSITNGGDRNSIFSSVDVTLGGTKSTMLNSNTSSINSSNSLWSMITNSTINNTSNIFGHNIQYSTMTNNSYNNVIMNSYSNVYGVFNNSFLFGGDNATRLSGSKCFLNFNTMGGKTVSDDNEELFGTIRFSNLTNNRNSSLFVNNSTLTNNELCFIAGESSTYVNNGQSTILGSRHSISNQVGGFVLGENIAQSNHSYQVLNFGSSPVQYPTQGSSSSSIDFNDIMYNFGTGNNTDYRSALTIFRNGKVKINQTKHFSSGTHSYSDVTPITTLDVDGDRGVRLPKLTSAQISSISSPENGEELYCTDCTANDSTVGVKMVYQASTSTWKKLW